MVSKTTNKQLLENILLYLENFKNDTIKRFETIDKRF